MKTRVVWLFFICMAILAAVPGRGFCDKKHVFYGSINADTLLDERCVKIQGTGFESDYTHYYLKIEIPNFKVSSNRTYTMIQCLLMQKNSNLPEKAYWEDHTQRVLIVDGAVYVPLTSAYKDQDPGSYFFGKAYKLIVDHEIVS